MELIIIIVLLIAALFFTIFPPSGAEMFSAENVGHFWAFVLNYYMFSSAFLFWIGIPAGWNLAKNHFAGIWIGLFCAFIGMYLSLPIAIVKLFMPKNR